MLSLVLVAAAVVATAFVGSVRATPVSILQTAKATAELSTLVVALEAGGLNETMDGAGTFTVFAPTDAAFAALPAGMLDMLLGDIPALNNVLLYHVLGTEQNSGAVVAATKFVTLNNDTIIIRAQQTGTPKINNAADLVADLFDVPCTNGIVHVIDQVLIPPANNLVEQLQADPATFSTLVDLVVAADLVGTLTGVGPFTVLAPTNAAFAKLPAGEVDRLKQPENKAELAGILTYHVVAGFNTFDDIVALNNTAVPTVNGATIAITATATAITVNGNSNVVTEDVITTNGVAHVLDTVLLPPTVGTPSSSGSDPTPPAGSPSSSDNGSEPPAGSPSSGDASSASRTAGVAFAALALVAAALF